MSMQTMPASDVRKQLHALLGRLTRPLFITARGRVKAVLLDVDEYNSLIDRMQDLEDACSDEVRRRAAEARTAADAELTDLEDLTSRYGV